MNILLKQAIIIIGVFLIVLWWQNIDDKKHKKERDSLVDKYKFPLLVSAFIGLLFNIPGYLSFGSQCACNTAELTIITPVKEIPVMTKNDMVKPFIKDLITEQQVFTDMPDF